MEILDLIAKVSWETNTKALGGINAELAKEDKLLDELREKGKRLNAQLVQTHDPKKVKAINDELQKTRKSVDSIVESQKKQATMLDSLNKKQADLVTKLKATSDPKLVQGLLRNLVTVENQMDALTKKAGALPSKIGGIGSSLLQGIGLGAGMFGLEQLASGISSFVSGSIAEFEDATKTALDLERALKAVGKTKYFDGLKTEADTLAAKFHNLFDNDDIIKSQTALVQYGKVTRAEISKLLPFIMDLASAEGIDLVQATEKVINIMEGRGGQTLRDYGLSVKGVKSEHDRLNLILGEFQTKIKGAGDAYATTAKGIEQANGVIVKSIEEKFGETFGRLKNNVLPFITQVLDGLNNVLEGNAVLYEGEDSPEIKALKKKIAGEAANKRAQNILKNIKADTDVDKALNPNASFNAEEVKKATKTAAEIAQIEANKKNNELILKARISLSKKKSSDTDSMNDVSGESQEIARVQKAIDDAQKKNLDNRDIAFDNDSTREAMLGIPSGSDIEAAKLNEDILTEQKRKAEKERTDIAKKEADERKRIAGEELLAALNNFGSQLSNIYTQEINAIDKVIDAQERRVEAAKNASDASLKIEQNRLDQLHAKRAKYEKQQRVMEAAIVTANQIVAISYAVKGIAKAAAEGGAGAALTVAANVVAVFAGIGAVVAALRSVDTVQGFQEGGYTGDGDPSETSTTLGKRGYKYHKKEFVMNEHLTTKHRDMLEGMHTGRMVVNKLNDGYYVSDRTIDVDKAAAAHYSVRNATDMTAVQDLLSSIDTKLSMREVTNINNFDADGFGQVIATQLGRVHLINKMRG